MSLSSVRLGRDRVTKCTVVMGVDKAQVCPSHRAPQLAYADRRGVLESVLVATHGYIMVLRPMQAGRESLNACVSPLLMRDVDAEVPLTIPGQCLGI